MGNNGADYVKLSALPFAKANGFTDEEFEGPVIGVANTFSEVVPGHFGLRTLAESVKKGIARAGGMAVEFGCIGCCDGIAAGTEGNKLSLPSRDLIAGGVEVMARAHGLDGLVLMGSCDKIVPGLLMAAARLNIPCILLNGGPMLSGEPYLDKLKADVSTVHEAIGALIEGKVTVEDVRSLADSCAPTCGSCNFYGTANTMCCTAEALGMILPGGAAIPAVYSQRLQLATRTGEAIVRLVQSGIRPRDIMTERSIRNAVTYVTATGGSTNAVLHLGALANELGMDPKIVLDCFEELGGRVPLIAKIYPASMKYDMADFFKAGGVPRVLKNLGELFDGSALTVTGRTWGEELADYRFRYPENRDMIRTVDAPHSGDGGIAVMRGNLCPETGIAKPAAIDPAVRRFTGEAICFDSEEECAEALSAGRVHPGHVIVIRYEGPKGGPGMREMAIPMKQLRGMGLATGTALITDGRFSGTNNGCFVGHICPEAAVGGPLALVRDGDTITVDVNKKDLHLHVSDDELARRREEWSCSPKRAEGYLGIYAKLVTSASEGAVLR